MVKNISVKLRNGVGIKMFRTPIRDGEIFKANINQIRKLFANKAVRKIWEHNDDNTQKIRVTFDNFKKETDWGATDSVDAEVESATMQEEIKEEPVVKDESSSEASIPDGVPTETFEGKVYEKVDDNYDPESGIVPEDEENK